MKRTLLLLLIAAVILTLTPLLTAASGSASAAPARSIFARSHNGVLAKRVARRGKCTNGAPLRVKCANGVMLGKEENGVVAFLGVPYAVPPVGDLRWKAPVPPADSDKTIECYEFGYTPLQYEWPTEPASYLPKSEDCLTLNVWTSSKRTHRPKAVLFYIPGGGYGWGGTADPIYNGQNFVEAHPDVILVSANYRLGVMAWPDFTKIPGGEQYTDINLGIRDHICALQWVQKNIAHFGGNPKNVTIWGESAGGMSVTTLMISPMAKGLFQKAIAESGVRTGDQTAEEGIAAAQEFAALMAETAGCKTMEDLLAVSGEEWMALDTEYWLADASPNAVADGVVIPSAEDYKAAVRAAAHRGIKLMIGANADEQNYFMTDAEGDTMAEKFANWKAGLDARWDSTYEALDPAGQALMDEFYRIQGQKVAPEYAVDPEVKDALIKSSFVTESTRLKHTDFADLFSGYGGDTYYYYWAVPSTSDDYFKSACHAVELAYVFNNLEDTIYCGPNPDKATAERAHTAWANFAESGNPSIKGVAWKTYHADSRDTMMIRLQGWKMEADPTAI